MFFEGHIDQDKFNNFLYGYNHFYKCPHTDTLVDFRTKVDPNKRTIFDGKGQADGKDQPNGKDQPDQKPLQTPLTRTPPLLLKSSFTSFSKHFIRE